MSLHDENITDLARINSVATANTLRTLSHIDSSIDRDVQQAESEDSRTNGSYFQSYYNIVWKLLWPDLILSNLNWPSLKIVLRSWLMMWSLTLLCIIGGTAEFMGPSSFLANFSCSIEIAGNLSVSAAFVSCMSDLITVVFAFAISVATMAINHHLRGYPTPQQILDELFAEGLCHYPGGATYHNCIVHNVYRGHFLRTQTTVVTIFGMLTSFTACGYFQTKSKYGKLQWLLNSLFTIVVFTFNNLTPLWEPWYYARNVVVPMVMAFSARFAVSLLVLPFSSNKQIVSQLSVACKSLQATATKLTYPNSLPSPTSSDFGSEYDFIRLETQATFSKHIVNEMDMDMVNHIEVSWSCFDCPDLSELRSLVRLVMSALSSFHFFYEEINSRKLDIITGHRVKVHDKHYRPLKHPHLPKKVASMLSRSYRSTGAYECDMKRKHQQHFRALLPEITLEELEDEFTSITNLYDPIVRSSAGLLGNIAAWLDASTSIKRNSAAIRSQRAAELRTSLKALVSLLRDMPHNKHHNDENWALHGYVCMHFARRAASLGRWCLAMQKQRPRPMLTWPFKYSSSPSRSMQTEEDLDLEGYRNLFGVVAPERSHAGFEPRGKVEERDPDATPPRRWFHLLGSAWLKVRAFIYDPDFIFSVKRAGLIIVTLIPYFTRTTAQLAYTHWFLWVGVLTSYTVAQQAVDGTYGLLAKFVFNFFGCLVGMVAWYISAGSGEGNPYGYAVVTAFVWIYVAFQRQFNKHFIPATSIVFSCTVTLVLGNSWNAGHIMLPGLALGKGFSVAWVRFVTVSIGITVSFIGTILPYPYTAKLAVREIIGNCIGMLGDLQSSISNFGVQRYRESNVHIVAHSDFITTAARALITNLGSAETVRQRLIYEPPLAGMYPSHRYKLLIKYVLDIAQMYALQYSFLDEIEDVSKISHILQVMGWTNPALSTGLYSVVYMTSRALVDGKALPSVTAGYLAESYIDDVLRQEQDLHDMDRADSSIVVAIALSLQIYKRFDGVVSLIKELVGEVYDVNLDIYDLVERGLPLKQRRSNSPGVEST